MDKKAELFIECAKQMERVMHKYFISEGKKRDYGLGYSMTRRKIHTIQFIGDEPGINMKRLAEKQGVTKGAASQMISKLVEKGLVAKNRSKESEAEVELSLTAEGLKAYEGHRKYHKEKGKEWFERFCSYPQEQIDSCLKILREMETLLDKDL